MIYEQYINTLYYAYNILYIIIYYQLISKKKKACNKKLTESLLENPKCFWSAVKSITKTRQNFNFLRTDGS